MNKKTILYINLFFCILIFTLVSAENITNNTTNTQNYNIEVIIPQTYKETLPGTDVWFTIKILNLGNTRRIDIVLISELIDEKNNIIVSKKKTVAMETQSSFVSDIHLPKELKPGKYTIIAKIEGTDLEAKQEINIKNESNTFIKKYFLIVSIVIIFIGFLIYVKKNARYWLLKSKIKKIINNRIKK